MCTFFLWLCTFIGREIVWCILHRWGFFLLFVMQILSWVVIFSVSSICLIVSKIMQWTFGELTTESCFSGQISRVHFVVKRLFTTVTVVVRSMQRLQMAFWTLPSLMPSCLFGVSGELSAHTSTILLAFTYVRIVFRLSFYFSI